MSALIGAAEVYPVRAGGAAFTILDVRAPIEVSRGALPQAVNIPILEDAERHLVGVAYRESGQQAAVALGQELTSSEMPARVARWREVVSRGPAVLACWRGGMRSHLAQTYLADPRVPRVVGGYKALRALLAGGLAPGLERHRPLVVTGMTGSGKTELIESCSTLGGLLAVDLEGLAHHRGSAFGHLGDQPSQQTFENALAAQVHLSNARLLLIEDESKRVGRLQLPQPVFDLIIGSPVVLLESPWQERIERIHRQYILEPALREGPQVILYRLREAVLRLRRRLGTATVEGLAGILEEALTADEWRNVEALEAFIGPLLREYYDPLYERAVARLDREVVARGNVEELRSWISRQI